MADPINDDVARLFRENDDLGGGSSLWLRPLRVLLARGAPPGPMTVLAFRSPEPAVLPFGVLTHTKRNRIVFWPVLPRDADMVRQDREIGVIDHVTLELPSEKTHVTGYHASGKPIHCAASDLGHKQAWRLHRFEGTGLAWWFTLLVRWDVLLDQDNAVQRRVCAPTTDEAERRKQEFRKYASQLKIIEVPLPRTQSTPDYVYCVVYFVPDPTAEITPTSDSFLVGDVDSQIDGWRDSEVFEIQPMRLRYEQTQFVIASACPPGQLREDVVMGFPRRRQS